jgi:hypothetical protein
MQRMQLFAIRDLVQLIGAIALAFSVVVATVYIRDPYGRSGIRQSREVPNLGERELMVSRARDPSFNSAIIGNSTSIPMQPEILNKLTDRKFVSLSISGSGAPVALSVVRFFLRYHVSDQTLILALDDTWCRGAQDMAEGRPFPFWLYGNDLDYLAGLYANASFEMLHLAFYGKPGGLRPDGYHPYDEAFIGHHYDNVDATAARMDRLIRPTESNRPRPFTSVPLVLLGELIAAKPVATFVLFWTPRYISIIPQPNTPAAEADAACKQQSGALAEKYANVRLVNWASDRPENRDPANFYEANHYRNELALTIQRDIAQALESNSNHRNPER